MYEAISGCSNFVFDFSLEGRGLALQIGLMCITAGQCFEVGKSFPSGLIEGAYGILQIDPFLHRLVHVPFDGCQIFMRGLLESGQNSGRRDRVRTVLL